MKFIDYCYYHLKYKIRSVNGRKFKFPIKDFGEKYSFLEQEQLNLYIKTAIEEKRPLLAGKFGGSEMFAMRAAEFSIKKEKACSQLCTCAGFFPQDARLLERYCEIMKDVASNLDILQIWDKPCEEYFLKKYCTKDKLHLCKGIANWMDDRKPWTMYLKNKKVLVIHPFAKSIKNQYLRKREKIYEKNPDILPEFELITLKAVQTIADEIDSRFCTWFEALDYMCSQIDQMDFDIALIGCGAYGLPLGNYVKKKQKIAIHIGGYLQLLFGIIGARWNTVPAVLNHKNEYWIRPSEDEIPKGISKVENGCYW